jgi:hypothetical protein
MDNRGTADVPVARNGGRAELPREPADHRGHQVDLSLPSRQPISGYIDKVVTVSPFDTFAARRAGLLALVVGGLFLCAAQWQLWATNGLSTLWALIGAAGAVAALVGMWSAANRYHAPDAAMAWAVVWLGAIAAAGQWIPLSPRANSPGLPHLAPAALAVCVGALCALLVTRRHLGVFSAITVIAGVVAVVAVVAQYTSVATSAIAAGVEVVGLIALSAMPRVALELAQILQLPVARIGRKAYATMEFTDAALFALEARIARAATMQSVLTPVASGIVAVAAVWTLDPHSRYVPVEIGIVTCIVSILVFRGRTMADRRQAYATCVAAAVATFGSAARLIVAWPTGWRPLVVMSVLAVGLAVFVIGTVVVPRRPVGPMLLPIAQRLAQQIEAIAIVLAILLCVWVSGVFGLIRNVTFGAS